jgi:hypothetical protein
MVVLGVWLFRRHKDKVFYYITFFVLMIPYMSLMGPGFWVAERYVYCSALCLLALASFLVTAALRHSKPIIRIGVSMLLAVFVTNNLVQHFVYQAQWVNGETLWQYHVSLPNPSPAAYENLAGYYYAQAEAHQGTEEAVMLLRKMEIVVDAGLTEFWPDHQQPPPAATYLLFFQKALIQEVNGDPEAALASLLTSDRLHPKFDSTYLNLSRVYRKLAQVTQDPRQRQSYSLAARDRLADYMRLAFSHLSPPPEVRQELAELETQCSMFSSQN